MEPEEPTEPLERLPPQERIAAIFREAGLEVDRRVAADPGRVDWFAIQRTGAGRPRTLFRALPHPPERPEVALAELEAAREATGADRAIGVVMEGALPDGHAPDLTRCPSNLLTFRRWFLEVSGIAEEVRELLRDVERSGDLDLYLPRRARLGTGEEVQVEPYLDAWAEAESGPSLVIDGPVYGGQSAVLRLAAYRSARRFLAQPETVRPLVLIRPNTLWRWFEEALRFDLIIPVIHGSSWFGRHVKRCLVEADSVFPGHQGSMFSRPSDGGPELYLLPPGAEEIEIWLGRHLRPLVAQRVREALRSSSDLRALAGVAANLVPLLEAARSIPEIEEPSTTEAWRATLLVLYFNSKRLPWRPRERQIEQLEDAALRQLVSGELGFMFDPEAPPPEAIELGWIKKGRLENLLVRDYFLARKVAREAEAGNEDILLRQQLPPDVFLFLTLLSSDLAARITGGAFGRMDQKVREEVERKLELTFAHILNRPVGAMRQSLEEIREGLDPAQRAALARPLARLEAEMDYLGALAEKTRLWRDEPTGAPAAVALRALCEELLRPLLQQHRSVGVDIDVAEGLRVRALPDALREALHCLLQNAFHAALAGTRGASPQVVVHAQLQGEIVRVEIQDSGDGVNQGDRERIFELFRTTKTGGAGRPRGTGLGLSIARRYVECMGGRVELDPAKEETCFSVELVAWKEDG